ncbi:hypothetical protein LINPERPRIM_LOCUS7593 [Linum perenne]
MISWKAALEG